MKYLIVANWKLNPNTPKEAKNIFEKVKRGVKNIKNTEVIICPPLVYLSLLKGLTLGAQNVFYKETGAFTGEVSPAQLVDLGIKYVIVGHSERRQLGETNYIINKKIKAALEFRLKPILCVGEKENEDKNLILTQQITEGLKNVSNFKFQISNLVVAYEPVWAIGTGKNCSVEETMVSVLTIKKIISKLYNKNLAEKIKVLYGGSVNSKNSGLYLKEARVNGLLVGGNSLDGSEFIKIVKQAKI